jgi:hypothetical protein
MVLLEPLWFPTVNGEASYTLRGRRKAFRLSGAAAVLPPFFSEETQWLPNKGVKN